MATDYGTDLAALDDLPLSDAYVSGADALVQALVHRLLTPEDGYGDCGDPDAFVSLDLREYLGARMSESDRRSLEARAATVLSQDDRVDSVTVSISVTAKEVVVEFSGEGTEGPFSHVLKLPPASSAELETA